MSNFIIIGVVGVICCGVGSALMVWLMRSGCSLVKLRLESVLGKLELLASKNADDLIVAQDRLASDKEPKRQGIEN